MVPIATVCDITTALVVSQSAHCFILGFISFLKKLLKYNIKYFVILAFYSSIHLYFSLEPTHSEPHPSMGPAVGNEALLTSKE